MDVREYLTKVSDQIAVPGIRDEVEKELLAHLADQKEAFLMEGMSDEEAEEAAVVEMGDPVEVGMELNEIHKPRPVKKYVAAFLAVNAGMFLLNAFRIMRDEAIRPEERIGVVSLVGLMMFFMVMLYLNIVYQKWERKRFLVFTEPGILSIYFVIITRISQGPPSAFYSLLLYAFVLIMVEDAMRNRRYARWGILLMWGVMAAPPVYLLWETPFLLLEVSLVYAGIFTLLHHRNWFPRAKGFSLYLYWSVPVLCILKLGYMLLTKEVSVSVSVAAVMENQTQSFLYDLTSRFGAFPAYAILLAGVFADVKLISLFRNLRSEWGKVTALTAALILGVMVLNGGLALLGILPMQYEFAPFLWKLGHGSLVGAEFAAQNSRWRIDYTQIILYYLYIGYLTRFTSRDSLLNLEMNALKNGETNPEKNRA